MERLAAIRSFTAIEKDGVTSGDTAAAIRSVAQTEKFAKSAGAEASKPKVEAEYSRTEVMIIMELENSQMKALPKVAIEMVKPAEMIKSMKFYHLSGGTWSSSGEGGEYPVVNQTVDSILDMVEQHLELKKIGEQVGLNVED